MDTSSIISYLEAFFADISVETGASIVGAFITGCVLFYFRFRAAKRRLESAEEELKLLKAQTGALAKGEVITSLERSRDETNRLLGQREDRLTEVGNALSRLKEAKEKNPQKIKILGADIAALQNQRAALKTEIRSAPEDIGSFTQAHADLQDLVKRTKGYVAHISGEIQRVNRTT